MKHFIPSVVCFLFVLLLQITGYGQTVYKTTTYQTFNFDDNWRFKIDSNSSAERTDFNDKQWRLLHLPHDWSIEDVDSLYPGEHIGHFSKRSPGGPATGFALGGVGWYRKHFILDMPAGKSATVYFDGVCMESDVWVNGKHVGFHPYGYTPFNYNITPYLNKNGTPNVIAVRAKNQGKNSRWYSGSGIYRSVVLKISSLLHVPAEGVFITTPSVTKEQATITAAIQVVNELTKSATVKLNISLYSPDGGLISTKSQSKQINENGQARFTEFIIVPKPQLWSITSPALYKVVVQTILAGQVQDEITESIGIRSLSFSAKNGFLLNDKMVKLKGACIHHDNGLLGAAAFATAEERKIRLLKAAGFNAIRTSHNPPSEKLLQACDRLGMLVIDEAFDMWQQPKNKNDYHIFFNEWWQKDLAAMVNRDRNHPSIILWSIGNEISERADSSGLRIAKEMIAVIRSIDSTRPVTQGVNSFWDHREKTWRDADPTFTLLDVGGYNYQWREYETDHQKFPDRIIIGTESLALLANENWKKVEAHPYVIGDFVWTGMDYLGETGLANSYYSEKKAEVKWWLDWPHFNAWCGDLDIIGNKKPQSFYRDVVWGHSAIEMAVHRPIPPGHHEIISNWGWPNETQSWNWQGHENDTMQVSVYSTGSDVRLYLNGKLIDEKKVNDSTLTARFNVPYQAGELKAVGLKNDEPVATTILRTTGTVKKILAVPERAQIKANRHELVYININIADSGNNRVPDAAVPLEFLISGEGELQAAGNASPNGMASFTQPKCITFEGRALLIIRSTGKKGLIKVQAKSKGLTPVTITVKAT